MSNACRLCGSSELSPVADFGSIPIAHKPLTDKDEKATLYPFALSICTQCGLVQVDEPIDPDVLYRGYNFNVSMWKFEPHMATELDAIFARGPIDSAVDIGCNDGRFLHELNQRGVSSLAGIEPNKDMAARAKERGLSVRVEMATEALCHSIVEENGGPFDLVVSRQVLEHVGGIDEFFACIDILLAPDGQLFLDMPDFEPSARLGDCSTLWDEHVNYFTESVLQRLLRRHGLVVKRLDKFDFSGGCLAVLAERGKTDEPDEAPDLTIASDFASKSGAYKARLTAALAAARDRGTPVAVYGSGVRACALANIIGVGEYIDFSLDDQAERQGLYIPGAAIRITGSEELAKGSGPLICLLAVNNESEARVKERATSVTNRPISFASVCGPRDIWAELARLEGMAERQAS